MGWTLCLYNNNESVHLLYSVGKKCLVNISLHIKNRVWMVSYHLYTLNRLHLLCNPNHFIFYNIETPFQKEEQGKLFPVNVNMGYLTWDCSPTHRQEYVWHRVLCYERVNTLDRCSVAAAAGKHVEEKMTLSKKRQSPALIEYSASNKNVGTNFWNTMNLCSTQFWTYGKV